MKPATAKRIISEIENDAWDVNIMIETKGGRSFVVSREQGDDIQFDKEDPDIMVLQTSMGTKWIDLGEVMSIEV